MAKLDNENLINTQSDTQFQDDSNPPPILPTNNIDSHEDFTFEIDENPSLKTFINVNSDANPSSSSLDSQVIVADLKNKIIGTQNDVSPSRIYYKVLIFLSFFVIFLGFGVFVLSLFIFGNKVCFFSKLILALKLENGNE